MQIILLRHAYGIKTPTAILQLGQDYTQEKIRSFRRYVSKLEPYCYENGNGVHKMINYGLVYMINE